ncbi:AraC family transcriptional regulator [Streptomyces griseofuscus]|uniref:helix-turn-helix transcriptional regulator n=1 Tax=Streptomyces griseofuscus TaxID=146922 RepID=UPI0033E5F239
MTTALPRAVAEEWPDVPKPYGFGEPEDAAIGRWLKRLSPDRLVHAPGLFGHYAMEDGWALESPAGIAEHLLYFVVSGGCTVTGDWGDLALDSGGIVWIRPHVPFSMTTPDDRQTVVYRFRLAADPDTDACLTPMEFVREAWEIRAMFDLLVNDLPTSLPHREERIRGLLLVLFTSIFRRVGERADTGVLSLFAREAVERFMEENIGERPRVADLARVVGLSPDYFTRTFRRTYGMPPREWIIRRRIQHAAAHLDRTGKPITQVAAFYGYTDSFLFSRQFKSVMGVAPQVYRAR